MLQAPTASSEVVGPRPVDAPPPHPPHVKVSSASLLGETGSTIFETGGPGASTGGAGSEPSLPDPFRDFSGPAGEGQPRDLGDDEDFPDN